MKKTAVIFTTAIAMAIPVCSFAAAWNVPSNVRIVQKSNTDSSGRIYSSIKAALDSITTTPTEQSPVLIKIMPGVYDLGTEPIQMKEFVTLEGSGAESTKLYSDVSEASGCTDTNTNVGAIRMANGSALKNLYLYVGSNNHVTGVSLISAVGASLEGVSIFATSDTGADGICIAAATGQGSGDLILKNSDIKAATGEGEGQANALKAEYGYAKVTASHCNFTKMSNYASGSGAVINMQTLGGADINITDSTMNDAGFHGSYILNTEGGRSTVRNSKFIGNCRLDASVDIANSMKIINSEIDLASTPGCFGMDNPSIRLVNNVDENGNVIAVNF